MERDGHGNEGLKKRTSFQEGEDQLTAGYVDGGPDRRTEVWKQNGFAIGQQREHHTWD